VLSRLGRLDEAMQQYQSIVDKDPGHTSAWLGLGQIAYKRCDLDRMAEAFEQAAALQKGNSFYQALPGAAFAARGAFEQQAQVYFGLSQDFPGDPVALLIGGEYAWQSGDTPTALEKFEQAAQSAQLLPGLQSQVEYNLGAMALSQNELAAAEEHLRRALQLEPANAASQTALGDIFLLRGDSVQAIQAYNLALDVLPHYAVQFSGEGADLLKPLVNARRAITLENLRQTNEAAQAWEQALTQAQSLVDQAPAWPQAHNTLGSVLVLQGDDARAQTEFAQAAKCDAWLENIRSKLLTHLIRLR
jgi:tetratricopeptide (TPR) repeat protein